MSQLTSPITDRLSVLLEAAFDYIEVLTASRRRRKQLRCSARS